MMRVNIPKNPDDLIQLALGINTKHASDGADSPLAGLNMTEFNTKTGAADLDNKTAARCGARPSRPPKIATSRSARTRPPPGRSRNTCAARATCCWDSTRATSASWANGGSRWTAVRRPAPASPRRRRRRKGIQSRAAFGNGGRFFWASLRRFGAVCSASLPPFRSSSLCDNKPINKNFCEPWLRSFRKPRIFILRPPKHGECPKLNRLGFFSRQGAKARRKIPLRLGAFARGKMKAIEIRTLPQFRRRIRLDLELRNSGIETGKLLSS